MTEAMYAVPCIIRLALEKPKPARMCQEKLADVAVAAAAKAAYELVCAATWWQRVEGEGLLGDAATEGRSLMGSGFRGDLVIIV